MYYVIGGIIIVVVIVIFAGEKIENYLDDKIHAMING